MGEQVLPGAEADPEATDTTFSGLSVRHRPGLSSAKHSQRGERGHFISLSIHYAKLKMTGQTKFERYRDELVRMMEEGIAKKEMARRTGLSVPTVRKY